MKGTTIRDIKGDTRSLDYSSHRSCEVLYGNPCYWGVCKGIFRKIPILRPLQRLAWRTWKGDSWSLTEIK